MLVAEVRMKPIFKETHKLLTCLFSCCPEFVRKIPGDDPTANGGRLSIFGNVDAVQLAHIDLNTMGHFTQRGDGAVHAIGGEEGHRVPACEFNLFHKHISMLLSKN